jgi:hypothetical protein
MEKARTQSDVPGYIYTFEIRGSFLRDLVALLSVFNPLQKPGNRKLLNSKLDEQ